MSSINPFNSTPPPLLQLILSNAIETSDTPEKTYKNISLTCKIFFQTVNSQEVALPFFAKYFFDGLNGKGTLSEIFNNSVQMKVEAVFDPLTNTSWLGDEPDIPKMNTSIRTLPQVCKKSITSLELPLNEPIDHYEILKHLPFLEKLTLYQNIPHAKSPPLKEIIQKVTHPLKSLTLSKCNKFTNEEFTKTIHRLAEHLEELHLQGCYQINTDCYVNFPVLGAMQQLTPASNINDEGLEAIATKCPNLTSIHLENCLGVTNNGLSYLAQKCPKLQCVTLNHSMNIGDEGVSALLTHCLELHHLELKNCPITSKAFTALDNSPHAFTHLDLLNCKIDENTKLKYLSTTSQKSLA